MKALKKQGTLGGTHNQDFPTDAAAKHTGGEAVQVHLAGLRLCRGDAGPPGQPLPQAHGKFVCSTHLLSEGCQSRPRPRDRSPLASLCSPRGRGHGHDQSCQTCWWMTSAGHCG